MKKILLLLCVLITITGFMFGNVETELSAYLDHETIDNITPYPINKSATIEVI